MVNNLHKKIKYSMVLRIVKLKLNVVVICVMLLYREIT